MTKRKQHPATAAEAVRAAIAQEEQSRPDDLKPIEIVKVALSAYQAYENRTTTLKIHRTTSHPPQSKSTKKTTISKTASRPSRASVSIESEDRIGFKRGTQAAMDRMLFNINYWRAAYEDRIVQACTNPNDALQLLNSISTWKNTPCRLNTRSFEDTQKNLFERFCPPLIENNRRGGKGSSAAKGPVPHFLTDVQDVIRNEGKRARAELTCIAEDIKAEAAVYRTFNGDALEALYDLLPTWCLQNRIELVCGNWWEDADVMMVIAGALQQRFIQMEYPVSVCNYFFDSLHEAIDAYQRDVTASWDEWQDKSIPELLSIVRKARTQPENKQYNFEIDGYNDRLPAWLQSKEQLIWNTIVCACYGPLKARPFLPETNVITKTSAERLDAITSMAQAAYESYTLHVKQDATDDNASKAEHKAERFEDQPEDLKASMLAQIESIHDKLAILGYHIVPAASCYPEQRIDNLTVSEVDCLAILEHRRWLTERKQAGWTFATKKNIKTKQTPHLVAWEDLPEQEREYNRRAVRIIPSLLASVGLAVSK